MESPLEKVTRLWKVYGNIKELLKDRGYTTVLSGKTVTTFEEFQQEFAVDGEIVNKQVMNFISQKDKDEDTKSDLENKKLMMIYFSNDTSIGIKSILAVNDKMKYARISHCILIYGCSLTPSAKKYLEKTQKSSIEAFAEDDLLTNITKHKMMPKHRVLSPTEKMSFFKLSNLVDSQLPRITVNDPIARYYGMKRGDVVQIIKKSETAGMAVNYRICN